MNLTLVIAVLSLATSIVVAFIVFFQARRGAPTKTQTSARAVVGALTVVTTVVAVAITLAVVVTTSPTAPSRGFLTGDVTVGTLVSNPGISYLDTNSTSYSGFDVDLIRYLADSSNPRWTPQIVAVSAEDRLSFLERGSRRIVPGLAVTAERLNRIDLTASYITSRDGFLIRRDQIAPTTLTSLAGRSICTLTGSTTRQQIEVDMKASILVSSPSLEDCVDRLRAGQVDLVAADQLSLVGFANVQPSLMVAPNLTFGLRNDWAIGLPYGSYEECLALSDEIQQFIASGSWNSFFARNFPGVDPAAHRPALGQPSNCLLH